LEIDLLEVKNPSNKTDPLIEYNKYFKTMKEDTILWHPDMIATIGWWGKLKEYYDDFDVVGLKLIYPNGLIHHFGGAIRPNGVGCHPHQYMLNIGLTKPLDCAFVTGPGTIIKKKVLDKIGGYDEAFIKGYYGDADWCFRARKAGFRVGVVPVEIIHEEGAESVKVRHPLETQRLQTEHLKIFVTKHMGELANAKITRPI
jgi:GT2 family glycosyltransferase